MVILSQLWDALHHAMKQIWFRYQNISHTAYTKLLRISIPFSLLPMSYRLYLVKRVFTLKVVFQAQIDWANTRLWCTNRNVLTLALSKNNLRLIISPKHLWLPSANFQTSSIRFRMNSSFIHIYYMLFVDTNSQLDIQSGAAVTRYKKIDAAHTTSDWGRIQNQSLNI